MVVNPESQDGTHEHLGAIARSYPALRICEVAVPSGLASNKGAMINAAIPFCLGEWFWFTDADCLFSPDALSLALQFAEHHERKLLYAQRRYLTAERTDDLLSLIHI